LAEQGESNAAPMLRTVLSGFLLLHFTALILGNLPWSPFIAVLYPTYSWYLRCTGQLQDWGMYSRPDRLRSTLWFTAHFDDGRVEHPWGDTAGMSARRVYLLESLLLRDGQDKSAERFLRLMLSRYQSDDRPRRLELGMDVWPTYGFEVQSLVGSSEPRRVRCEVYR
jgi:hypothetical protein